MEYDGELAACGKKPVPIAGEVSETVVAVVVVLGGSLLDRPLLLTWL
jgi:hypothetical protein